MSTDTPNTDKTAVAYLAGEIGPQDILHDMGQLERELAAETEKVKSLREVLDWAMTAFRAAGWENDAIAIKARATLEATK